MDRALSITRGSRGTVSKATGDGTGRFRTQRPIWPLVTRLLGLGQDVEVCNAANVGAEGFR